MRRLTVSGLALALIAAVVLWGAPHQARAADPYNLYAIVPVTGTASFLGQQEALALGVLEKYVNAHGGLRGQPVHFIIKDDQSSPQVAVQLTNEVLANKIPVVFGSSLVGVCNAMSPLFPNGPVQYCLSPGIHPATGSYVFSSSVSTHDLATVMVRYFRSRGWTRLALMTSTDATGQDAEQNFNDALSASENKSMTLVAREHFAPADVSVAAQIARVKAANPQVLVAWTTGAPFGTVLRGIAEAGLDIPIGAGNGNLTYGQMHQYAQFLPKQLYFAAPASFRYGTIANGPFKEALDLFYAQIAPTKPGLGETLAWDPAMIVIDALRRIGPEATGAQLRDYLEHLHGWAGINGIYDFRNGDQRGLGVTNAAVVRWTANKDTWVAVSKAAGQPLQ